LPVAQLKIGMHVLRADGRYGVITGYRVVPGSAVMYNLEVEQDHTFVVGAGEWVVHNCSLKDPNAVRSWIQRSTYQDAIDEIGRDGVQRFTNAMQNGIVRAQNAQGIKWIGGVVPNGESYDYELKVLAEQYANWRFYGNFDEGTGHIIFKLFGRALH